MGASDGLPNQLLNVGGVPINPATEEKQDDIIAAIQAGGGGTADIVGINGVAPSVGAGSSDTGTLRVAVATNDVNLSAIKTAIEILDNIVSGNEAQVDIVTMPGIAGDVAHDSADSGNPVKVGFKSASATSLPTATTVGDRTNQAGSTQGEAFVYGTRLAWDEDETNELGKFTLKPVATNTYNLTWENSTALETSSVVKASAGNAYVAHVYNNNAAVRYFQVYNSTTVPADTAVPIFSIPIAAGGYQRVVFGLETGVPYNFSTGISWANSTTYATKTVGGSDFWVNFGYM
jgi:hypothetical protein